MVAGLAFELVVRPQASVGYFTAVLASVFAVLVVARNGFPRSRPVTIHATRAGLALGEGALIPVDQIAEVKLVPVGEEAIIRLTLRRGHLVLRMMAAGAERVLKVLGVFAGERRTSFTLELPFRTRFLWSGVTVGLPLMGFVTAASGDPLLIVVTTVFSTLPICVLLAALLGVVRGRLVLGADGFAVRWLARERFFAFASVKSANRESDFATRHKRTPAGILVELVSGRKFRLRVPDAPVDETDRGTEAHALHDHFLRALEHSRARPHAEQGIAALLAAGSRGGPEWLAHLDELVRGGAQYRVAAASPELLARITSDPASPAEARIGAAAALARLDDQGRKCVRIAADACAEPRLRAVLVSLSVAETDQEFIESLALAKEAAR